MFATHITHEEIDVLPYVAFGGKITVVKKVEEVSAAVACLMQEKVLGYDTETRPSFTRGVRYNVSLLQLSSAEQAFLFRIDKIGIPQDLLALLQDKQVLKVGAAIHDDIRGMQRIAPFKAQGFIDLQKMAEAYGIEDKALKKLAAIVLQLRISKSQQTSNWAAANYTAEQKLYAATDAWICREIYLKLLGSAQEKIAPVATESFIDADKPKPKKKTSPSGRRMSMVRRAQQKAGEVKKK